MARPASRPLILVAAGLVAVAVGIALFARGGGDRTPGAGVALTPDLGEGPLSGASQVPVELDDPERLVMTAEDLARTTVLWPLRVELELVQASYLPDEAGIPTVGSGATATLTGRIAGPDDRGARAEIRFVAGPNEGRVLPCDVSGSFGATTLYPGLSIVEVRGPGLIGSRREVRLRQDREALLNIGYGRPGSVLGRVQDKDGAGMGGAQVTVDGTRVTTDPNGEFFLNAVASGQVLVEVEHEGYAAHHELVWIAGGRVTPKDQMTFTLLPASSLEVIMLRSAGGQGPAQLFLLPGQEGRRVHPASAHRNMRFPWHRMNPVEVWPGRATVIEGLPAEAVRVYAFKPGAEASMKVVSLRADHQATVRFQLDAAPLVSGRVTLRGEPVAGAQVRLEAPNRVRATLAFFRQGSHYLETSVMPSLPVALQEVETDSSGRFILTAWGEESPAHYLEARGPDGKSWAGRLVRAGEESADLELVEVDLSDAALRIAFPGRHQGLPLEVVIDGAPLDPSILPPEETLRIDDLISGRWHVKMTWHSTPVHEETLSVGGESELSVTLPPHCIDGQDEEAWRRAGREYP